MAHLGASHSKPTRFDLPLKWWTPRKEWGLLTQEGVNMGQMRRSFTREFKSEAVKLVIESGRPTAQVARDLGITPDLLRRWKQEVAGDPVESFPGEGTAQAT
jgi:transposase-like protein